MMQELKKFTALAAALVLGTVASLLLAGCQPTNAPPKKSTGPGAGSRTTSPSVPPTVTGPAAPMEKETAPDATEPSATKEPSTEPKKEETPSEPQADAKPEPAPEKPVSEKPTSDKPADEKPTGDSSSSTPKGDTAVASAAGVPAAVASAVVAAPAVAKDGKPNKGPAIDKSANAPIKPGDWAQWGGTSFRNNTPIAKNIPIEWDPGKFDRKTGEWKPETAKNIKWVVALGSQTYGNVVIADGKVWIGTNNASGFVKRYPADVDLGALVCLNEADGKFLWQHSSEKLPTGRVHDWPMMGICCSPLVEGKRLWFVTSRGEVRCLDTEGFYDDKDDGPVKNELGRLFDVMKNEDAKLDKVAGILEGLQAGQVNSFVREKFAAVGAELPEQVVLKTDEEGKKWSVEAKVGGVERSFKLTLVGGNKFSAFKVISIADKDEADVIWSFDMMGKLGVSQHNMCSCSVTTLGDILFVCTSNGVDESHANLPAPDAPSFIAMDKNTGEVFWTDKSPGLNIHHGQWTSPTVAVLGGVPQVLFGGGDCWLYSFRADKGQDGKPELLWKADLNPKDSKLILGGRGTRNDIIGTPVVYDGLVYVGVGQDPEHNEGPGNLWCIDPTKRGDVGEMLAVDRATQKVIPHRRIQAVDEANGEIAIPNPNSAIVWRYASSDQNGDGKIKFEEIMHRTCGTVAIKNDLLFVADFSGLFHCLDAKIGKVYWTYDMKAASWGSPLIVGDKVYIGDEDGDVAIFELKGEPHEPIFEVNMLNSVLSTPVVANGVLYISNKDHLFAIQAPEKK